MPMLQRIQRAYEALFSESPTLESRPAEERPILQPGQIDVRSLIERYDAAKHAELADAYFEPLVDNPVLRRKPFSHAHDAVYIMASLAHVMEGLRLFPQATVLDFGAGTCWSSRILASVGCRVTALDVSKNALKIGRSVHEQDPLTRDLPIDFQVFDGRSIPAGAASFDRILSFDAFHHAPDQAGLLREFSRVLVEDGIVGFAEPGPYHSLTPTSQMEMRAYNVIENDIRVEEIWDTARACGFADIRLSFTMPYQELLSLDEFNRILAAKSAPDEIVFSAGNVLMHKNRRVFFLYKSTSREQDSRFVGGSDGLRCAMQLRDITVEDASTVRLALTIENVGKSTWRASGGGPGCVNIGVHLRGADNSMLDNDFTRLSLSSDRVRPGEKREVNELLPLPELDDFTIELDPVAENVTWFELTGGSPLRLTFRNRRYVAQH
ncbi:class I SAM-dependent methyltransferase [Reyranella sp.]|uniref:class I SAM-dependent methyltransferase n=1 Tax=Reyranella sp. TaxID=1929291 RepID=UPI0037846E3F